MKFQHFFFLLCIVLCTKVAFAQPTHEQGDLDSLTLIIDKGEGTKNSYFLRSIASYHSGDFNTALDDIDYCLSGSKNELKYLFHKASVLDALGRTNEAFKIYEECVKTDKNNCKVLVNFGLMKLELLGDSKSAMRDFNRCIKYEPTNYNALMNRATIFLEMSEYNKAKKDIDVLLRLYSHDIDALILKGYWFEDVGQIEKAKELYITTISLDTNNINGYLALARILESSNADLDSAVLVMDNYINNVSESIEGRVERARLNAERGRYRAAIRDIDYCLGWVANDEELWLLKGDYEYVSENYSKAIKAYSNAISIDIENLHLEYYLFRGLAYMKLDDKEHACFDFQKATISVSDKQTLNMIMNYCSN